ncbi:unnamed protein product [Effrenium voratum]|nr:unnamed protein product [Effrenium voratum]
MTQNPLTVMRPMRHEGSPLHSGGILAECAWGRVKPPNGSPEHGWQLVCDKPLSVRPPETPELVSYLEYLEQILPGKAKDMKKKREQMWKKFTEPGQPGEELRPFYQQLESSLAGHRMVGTNMVIAAFFELLVELLNKGRSFSIVFRTFGSDLPAVQAEFNAFCAGQHPKYPDLRLDGSAEGKPDLRLKAENTGSWYRSSEDMSVVWGTVTLEEDLAAAGGVLDEFLSHPDNSGLTSSRGLEAVVEELRLRTSQPSVLALRDYFPYWQRGGQHGPYGKPLLVDTCDHRYHPVFFDDNITLDTEDTKIVDARDKTGRALWPVYAQRYFICRAEPLLALLDDRYFIRKVEEKERCFFRKRRARMRLRAATLAVSRIIRDDNVNIPNESQVEYDAWKQSRISLSRTHFSSSTAQDDEKEHEIVRKP